MSETYYPDHGNSPGFQSKVFNESGGFAEHGITPCCKALWIRRADISDHPAVGQCSRCGRPVYHR